MKVLLLIYIIGVLVAALIHKGDIKKDFLENGSLYPDEFLWHYIITSPPKELFYSWFTVFRQLLK